MNKNECSYDMLKAQFLNPDDEYSPVPFWFWNDDIQESELTRQIEDFKEKGVNAFVIHPRIGIPESLRYMSEEFLNLVKYAVMEAHRLNMKVVLYDEAMYPSGSAHGMVADFDPMYKSRGIRRVTDKNQLTKDDIVILEQDGIYYAEGFTGGTIRGIHFGEDDGEENAPKSADLLNEAAVKCFISLTHDKYYKAMSEYFGNTITGIFTDEPSIMGRRSARGFLPWSTGFLEYYQNFGGNIEDIPKFWEDSPEKKLYFRAVASRLEEVYYKPISQWCGEHKVALMGHPEKSDDIALLKYFHIPGQDVVLRWVAPEDDKSLTGTHSTQAKCSSDSARHAGKKRNSNECFGACNKNGIPWYFTGGDMKWYIDWLCVRGVNMLIPHAFYYSVEGRRKDERPPDVGPNNIWWDDYKIISTYIKRLCWIMTDSVNTADIAVLCGGDSLDWEETAVLYQNQVEFNYLEEFYITEKNIIDGHICIKNNKYGVLLIPKNMSLSEEKREILTNNGVKIVSSAKEALTIAARGIICETYTSDLRVSNVIKGNKNFYLFVNEGEEKIETTVEINKSGSCEFWNPLDGKTACAAVTDILSDSVKIYLYLERRESLILYLDESEKPKIYIKNEHKTEIIDAKNIKNGNFFVKNDDKNCEQILNLGDFYEYIKLYINEKYVGTKMWSPYKFDITDYVNIGKNTIRIIEKHCKAYDYGYLR